MSGAGDSGDDSAEKSFEPTPHRLQEARRKGDLPRSTDLSAAGSYLGLWLVLVAAGGVAVTGAADALLVFFDRADTLSISATGPGGLGVMAGRLLPVAGALAPVLLLPIAAALLALLAQRVFVVVPSKLAPKLTRISPLQGLKNKFGPNGLFEFAKTVVKMLGVGVVVSLYLIGQWDNLIGAVNASPGGVGALMGRVLLDLLAIVAAMALAIGGVDYAWQHHQNRVKLRMSHKDMRDEVKQHEGDPYIKAQRRARGQAIATNRMLADVPKADVIVVNPQHYAVALRWSRQPGTAPVCVAKGVDEIAARIREVAAKAGVPLHRDPPTARALHATVDIGHEIRPEQYRAVAAAIGFAETMRRKARERTAP
jgi:flagellar biosynthesis protein FlhB